MKKILLFVVLILFGITTQLTAQVNGTAARPLVSTAAKPVYYYIENQSATTGYTGNVLLPGTAVGQKLRHLPMPTDVESAKWQLVNEGGIVKLKNKKTGYYMSVSHTYATAGDVFELSKYEGFTYYKMRSGRQSPTLAYNNNLCDRQTAESDKLHWYFIVAPESDANYQELIATNPTLYFTDYGLYARTDNARKLNSLSFTAAQNTTLTINQQTVNNTSAVYFDKTTQIIEVVPGSNLSVSFNWTGTWMRNIAYVDWNNDKLFSTTDATERIGYNALAGSGTEMTKSITYAVPAGQALGDYRMRIMVDWFDNHSSPNEGKFDLNYNGGSVVDVILRVTNTPLPASPSVSFGTSNLIVKGDAFSIIPPTGATVKYTTDNTDPAVSSTAVTGTSIVANGNFKLRAISVNNGVNSSELVRDIKTIDLTLGNEYYIVFQRTGNTVNPTLALKDMGDGVAMQTQTLQYGQTTQRWTVSKGTSDGLYKLTSIAGNIMYYNGSKFTVSASPAVDAEVDMRFITFSGTSGYTQYSGYEIQRKNSTTMGMNPIGGSAISKEIGEWNNGDGGNAINFMNTKGLLLTEIQKTQAIHDGAITGSEFGQASASSKADLQTVINNAQLDYEKSTSADDLTAITSLQTAANNFKNIITNKNKLISADENKYKWYTIRSTGTATYVANKVISSNGRILTNKFTFENAGTPVTDAQLFRFEISGSEIIIINKANGYYMATDGAISSTSATFALNLLTDGYSFNIKPASANAIHAQEAGSTIVNWAGDAGSASAWVFDYQKTTPKVPEFSGTGNWSDAANWVDNALPDAYNDVIINGAGEAVLDVDASYNSITINSGKSLSVAPGKGLTIGGTLINNGTLTLQSDATGTATILSPATITSGIGAVYNVQQWLTGKTGTSTRANWYLSSPVSGATTAVFNPAGGTNKITWYNETVPGYVTQIADNTTALVPGRGYATYIGGADAAFTFTGGTLNNGDITLTPTRTGTTAAKRGFNLVGNPYPSYLNWDAAYTATVNPQSNMRNAIWYRTYTGGAMVFNTYANEESVPLGANGMIPPMQAFWVKVKADGSNGSITFKNTYRSHATGSTFPLKAKALTEKQSLRLVVSNGVNTDETLIVGKPYASAAYDEYDAEKMSNNNAAIPEIYSLVESQELVINSVDQLTEGKTVTLGFRPGQTGTFTIEATQLDNIDAKVMLLDKVAGTEQELTVGTPYTFTTTDATPTTDRLVISLVSRVPTGIETGTSSGEMTVYTNRSNRIQVIYRGELNDQTAVSVYNVAGQMLSTQKLVKAATELSGTFRPGVYMIQLSDGTKKATHKLVIK